MINPDIVYSIFLKLPDIVSLTITNKYTLSDGSESGFKSPGAIDITSFIDDTPSLLTTFNVFIVSLSSTASIKMYTSILAGVEFQLSVSNNFE